MKLINKLLVASTLSFSLACTAQAQSIDTQEFAVVGTWGQLDHWKREDKFWNQTLPEVSGGKLTANAKPLTELGMDGQKIMRDLRAGAFDFAHGVFLYVSSDSPVIEGGDLSAVSPDLETFRKVMNAYRPVLDKEFEKRFNSKILMLYAFDETNMQCKLPADTPSEVGLDVFQNLKIRSYGSSISDFISEALDAVPVSVSFGEVLHSLQKNTIDCGVSGVRSAYDAKWWQVATHNVNLSLGYTASFLAVNLKTWKRLSPDTQKLIESEVAKLEEEMWQATARNNTHGLNCITSGQCDTENGNMKLVRLTEDASKQLKQAVNDSVVRNWASRCKDRSKTCVDDWNNTVGKVVNLHAE